MNWGTRIIQGTVYPLQHLDRFVLSVVCGGPVYRVEVTFGAHCFTRETVAADTPDLWFMDGRTKRTFCVNRYAHSLHLSAAILQASCGDVCASGRNYVIGTTLPGLTGPYLIAFGLRVGGGKAVDIKMDILSAHHRPNFNGGLPRARFNVLINNTMRGARTNFR